MKFCIRVDDFGWTSSGTKDPGLEMAQKYHAAMQGLPYLAAVIPSCVDGKGLAWLRSCPDALTVAMHGFNHELSGSKVASEFHDSNRAECRLRIALGKRALQNVPVAHMVLPFNAYEPDLAEACYLEGLHFIWGGSSHCEREPSRWPVPPPPYPLGRVTFVPSWEPTYAATLWRMKPTDRPLEETLPALLDQPGKAIITLHITWEAAKCEDFKGVRWLVDLIRDRIISSEEYLA